MPGLDPAKVKALVAAAKQTIQAGLSQKGKDGNPLQFSFLFAPGKGKTDHIVMLDRRKKGAQLVQDLKKLASDRKKLCFGTAWVSKEEKTLFLKPIKKMSGADRLMTEGLRALQVPYKAKYENAADDSEDDDGAAEAQDDDADAEGPSAAGAAADDDDESEAAAAPPPPPPPARPGAQAGAQAGAAAAGGKMSLTVAPQVWAKTRSFVDAGVNKLKQAVRQEYKDHAPDVIQELEKGLQRCDRIQVGLSDEIIQHINNAAKAAPGAARNAELAKAKTVLAKYIQYVQSEPLIKQLDENPFGVVLNLQKALSASLKQIAQSISI